VTGLPVCTQCGFTHAEFLARGLLGCPACYAQLGATLRADLLHMHPGLHRRPPAPPPREDPEDAGRLHERLQDALRGERYEEAAELRRRLDARGGAR
jgi:protein arginine kinase activator